jgi:hypothetical protein
MSGEAASRHYVGPEGLDRLRGELSGRDLAIVGQLAELRLMSAKQITAIHFTLDEHDNELAAARASQRVLARLAHDGLVLRLERRIGGMRAGSAGYIYGLGALGQRALGIEGPRRRRYEPSLRFLDHTLAITQLVVVVTAAARSGALDILSCQAEPRCHREFSGLGGRVLLRPDMFLVLGVGEFEHRWFVEIDRGTESVPVVLGKCRTYDAYYRSGREQAAHGVFPTVCWIVPDPHRAEVLRRAIAKDRRLGDQLFVVTTMKGALGTLTGGQP